MTVGEKIYTLRTKSGYSQEDFAELIGVSRQSVSKWETSSVMPDTEYVVKICNLLHISTDQLLVDEKLPVSEHVKRQQECDLENDKVRNDINKLSLVGFIFSCLLSIIGLILSCIAIKRSSKLSEGSPLFAVSGTAVAAAKLFGELILIYNIVMSALSIRGIL